MATPTTFRQPLRFRCLEVCGLCCTYRVAVLAGETAFLRKYGDAVLSPDPNSATETPNTGGHLRRKDGHCVFLDAGKRCTIYEERPLYCRLYPLVRDSYPRRQIDANLSCPGLGGGELFTEDDIEGVAELESSVADLAGWEVRQHRSYKFACRTLSSRETFAPQRAMAEAVCALVRDALLTGPALDVGERLHRLVEAHRPAFLSCGNVGDAEALLELFGGVRHQADEAISDGEDAQMLDYLVLWTRRNLTLRAAHAQALAAQVPVNVFCDFVELIAKVAGEVCQAAWRLPRERRIQEAIRQLDASLRSRFMHAAILAPS